jgi:hypothetical protein
MTLASNSLTPSSSRSGFKGAFKRALIVPLLLATALPAVGALAQAQGQAQFERAPRLSADAMNRLLDARVAFIKQALKLNDAQLKLWAPVEEQMRAAFAARQKLRAERQQERAQGGTAPSLADRLERASQRMTERAQHMKAFADAFKPFYATLDDEQKAIAGFVLRMGHGVGHGGHRHWAMHRAFGAIR